jgi:nucleoid-associated protein YgaU
MAFDQGSRYRGLPTLTIRAADGSARVLVAPRVVPEPDRNGTYDVRAGDRLDLLGRAATGDTTRWWILADANPWSDATRLERAGQTIGLPRA